MALKSKVHLHVLFNYNNAAQQLLTVIYTEYLNKYIIITLHVINT